MEITQEYLKSIYDYRDDGKLIWKVRKAWRVKIGDVAGCFHIGLQRRTITVHGRNMLLSRMIFLYHKGYLPEFIDHEDRNGLNDRIENLRAASRAENCKNRTVSKNSACKYLGVTISGKKFKARIRLDGKNKQLGNFIKEQDAALAYNKAAVMYHGEFASLNIITPTI